MSEFVSVEVVDRVQIITLNRPQACNAINLETAQALAEALDQLDASDQAALGILTGAGGNFSAGMDLKEFSATGRRPHVEGRGFAGICEKPPRKPLIAAVEGYALAGGFEMALACDLIVASRDASFGLPEVKRGLVPFSGGMVLLPSRIPYHIAMEAVLSGDSFTAERMHGYGLVNHVVEPGKAVQHAMEIGRRILQNSPMAVQTAKRIMVESRGWRVSDVFNMQRPLVTHIFESVDAKEGAQAFAEKREPAWRRA